MSLHDTLWPLLKLGAGKPPVLFLHGFMGCKEDWRPIMDSLAEYISCIAVDLPGHGRHIDMDDIPTFEAMIKQLDELRISSEIKQWHMVGYSMGGRIALHYALAFPQQVASLTLISASPGIEDRDARAQRIKTDRLWAERLATLPRDEFLAEWYGQSVFSSLDHKPELRNEILRHRLNAETKLFSSVLESWGQGKVSSVWSRMTALTMPVQFIAGQLDSSYCHIVHQVKNLFPHMQITILDNAGHTVQFEQPDNVVEVIRKFINVG